MRRPLLSVLLLSACYGGASIDVVTGDMSQEPGVDAPGGSDVPGDNGSGPSMPSPTPVVPGAPTGLPCDVSQLLASKCQSCHRTPPAGAPMPLLTREHLLAPAPSDPSRTVASVSVERMKSTTRPMPPGAPASAQEIAVLEAWVTAGTPAGECGGSSSADGGSMPATPQPAPTVCTSGDFWTRGRDGSELMFPGRSCQGCHRTDDDAPRLTIAGTVFPTLHEKDDCYGDKDVVVEITDALGVIVRLTSNNYGNFRSSAPITPPIRAKLIFDGRVREMVTPQPTGDCNSCHTEQGANGAPGRILKP